MNVFTSSTYQDLKDYRLAAIEAVNRYKCVPLAMEFMMAQPGDATTVSKKEVEEMEIPFHSMVAILSIQQVQQPRQELIG